MTRITDTLADQNWRYGMGRRFEAMTDEIFQVIRWVLSALLFGYIASRFLLRPEIPFLGNPSGRMGRLIQSALNFLLCIVVFGLTIYAVSALTEAIAAYRGAL